VAKRQRGQGGLFKHPKSRFFIAKWYDSEGRPHSQSTHTDIKQEAEKTLRTLMGDADKGVTARPESITYAQIREDLLAHYRNKGHKSLGTMADGTEIIYPLIPLDRFFNHPEKSTSLARITHRTVANFIGHRQAQGIGNAAINNSLSLLRRMLHLAKKHYNLPFVAPIDLLRPPPPRKGFLSVADFNRLLAALPSNLRPLVTFLYYSGARKGEACAIRRDQIDLKRALVTLDAEQTKTDEARVIPLPDVLVDALRRRKEHEWPANGLAFDSSNLRKCWEKACDETSLGKITPLKGKNYYLFTGLMLHDLRRSGARNLRKAGVPEGVCMAITGHKDRSVFERYNIVDTEDVQDAIRRLERSAAPTVGTTRRLLNGKSTRVNAPHRLASGKS
jgi:integrase